MSRALIVDGVDLTDTAWRIGDWHGKEGAPHMAPWDTFTPTVRVVWHDARHTLPVSIEDHDGCRAPVYGKVPE